MKCPTCKDTMLTMSERQGIEIDFCPDCRGVWLDRGELDKIIERSESSKQAAIPTSPIQQNTQYYETQRSDQYKYKRKKSFLEEIFD